jgi:hypothetical protein
MLGLLALVVRKGSNLDRIYTAFRPLFRLGRGGQPGIRNETPEAGRWLGFPTLLDPSDPVVLQEETLEGHRLACKRSALSSQCIH